ncbi:MAG TPA: hypothetical protein VFW25_08130 [Silvibacterium sp.]|nr:hypothetical protein [Silvibacterium sp.]
MADSGRQDGALSEWASLSISGSLGMRRMGLTHSRGNEASGRIPENLGSLGRAYKRALIVCREDG